MNKIFHALGIGRNVATVDVSLTKTVDLLTILSTQTPQQQPTVVLITSRSGFTVRDPILASAMGVLQDKFEWTPKNWNKAEYELACAVIYDGKTHVVAGYLATESGALQYFDYDSRDKFPRRNDWRCIGPPMSYICAVYVDTKAAGQSYHKIISRLDD